MSGHYVKNTDFPTITEIYFMKALIRQVPDITLGNLWCEPNRDGTIINYVTEPTNYVTQGIIDAIAILAQDEFLVDVKAEITHNINKLALEARVITGEAVINEHLEVASVAIVLATDNSNNDIGLAYANFLTRNHTLPVSQTENYPYTLGGAAFAISGPDAASRVVGTASHSAIGALLRAEAKEVLPEVYRTRFKAHLDLARATTEVEARESFNRIEEDHKYRAGQERIIPIFSVDSHNAENNERFSVYRARVRRTAPVFPGVPMKVPVPPGPSGPSGP